ncbi:hypothetical protein [Jiangella muralis]|uniref:hypothetical protein n=1 Tax=Jiangella muralis TaxID=702383 RepID=UPI0012FCE6BC|nr:hypothetical protein [Jiangella muralis]
MTTRAVDDEGTLARGAQIIRAELDRLVRLDEALGSTLEQMNAPQHVLDQLPEAG